MPENELPVAGSESPAPPAKRFGFQPGHKKVGGRKAKLKVLPGDDPKAVAEKLGFHSFEQVIRIIQTGLIETVGSHPRTVEVKERVRLLIEILPHLHAKPQAPIEVTGKDGGPIAHAHVDIMALMANPELAKAAETLSLAMNPIPVARLKAMQDQETAVRRGLRVVED